MATKDNDDGINAFQTFSTLLALLLPILQFFFNFIPQNGQKIFVIESILVPVSVIAGIFSYMLIIAFKNIDYFEFAFNRSKKRAYDEHNNQIAYIRSEPDDQKRESLARQLQKNPIFRPFYLTPLNIYMVLIPSLLIFILIFLTVGIFYQSSSNRLMILIQSVSYIFSVSLTSLTLAVFYINETNRKIQQKLNRDKYKKIIQLLFDNNSLPEFPNMEFVAQDTSDFMNLRTYIKVNNKTIYEITSDMNGDVLKQVIVNSANRGGNDDQG